MLLRNKSGQGIYLYAYTISTGAALAGDAANIVGSFGLDDGAEAALATTHPTDRGHGIYWQPLAQAETDGGAYAYSWASSTPGVAVRPETGFTAGVQLADGVNHGGTPGSSTANYAGQLFSIQTNSGNAIEAFCNAGSGRAVYAYTNSQNGALSIQNDGGIAIDIESSGGDGSFPHLNPAVLISQTSNTGRPGLAIISTGVDGKAIRLSGDAASDALAIAAGGGSPVDVFDAAGGVKLSADGLDAITDTELSAPPSNFREMIRWVYQRLAGKAAKTLSAGTGTVIVKTAAGATATTQAIADDGAGNQTQGLAS